MPSARARAASLEPAPKWPAGMLMYLYRLTAVSIPICSLVRCPCAARGDRLARPTRRRHATAARAARPRCPQVRPCRSRHSRASEQCAVRLCSLGLCQAAAGCTSRLGSDASGAAAWRAMAARPRSARPPLRWRPAPLAAHSPFLGIARCLCHLLPCLEGLPRAAAGTTGGLAACRRRCTSPRRRRRSQKLGWQRKGPVGALRVG